MKIAANAGELANALALAASLSSSNKGISNIVGLEALCLAAADDELTIAADVLDFAITLTVPAVVESPGEVAVSASRLSALAAGFLPEATIEIQSDGTVCRVGSDRSRFKLPTIALDGLPAPLKLAEETGRVALAREEAATLLVRPAFAASTEKTRIYFGGVLLHDNEGALAAVATDGHRLVLTRVPGARGLSAADFKLIVPNAALKIIGKLLADKDVERITLRRSKTLLSVEGARFVFVSKLIDAIFPNYPKFIPKPSGNTVTVDRAELLRALDRIAAVAEDQSRYRVVGLMWSEGEPELRLCLVGSDAADDSIAAEVTGKGRTAAQIHLLAEMVDELNGKTVKIDSGGAGQPILILDSDDVGALGLVLPYAWAAQTSQAA
jgi:DNA polymerase III subunit beta